MNPLVAGREAAPPRPWVKICGVTRPEDAQLAARLGATFVGVNFWPGSKRRVDVSAAREIARALSDSVELVGVFVNEDPARMEEIAVEVGLDRIQLHGDEPDEVVALFGSRALRALRAEGSVAELMSACSALALDSEGASEAHRACVSALDRAGLTLQWRVFAVVLDSSSAGTRYGGTGEEWQWSRAAALCAASPTPILIGGVRPENATEVLRATGSMGIDLASGVESAPGIKNEGRMRMLFEEVARVRRIE